MKYGFEKVHRGSEIGRILIYEIRIILIRGYTVRSGVD